MSKGTTEKTVSFTLDANTLLSADEQTMLARLAAMSDSDINCSDIPPSSPDAKWAHPGSTARLSRRTVSHAINQVHRASLLY